MKPGIKHRSLRLQYFSTVGKCCNRISACAVCVPFWGPLPVNPRDGCDVITIPVDQQQVVKYKLRFHLHLFITLHCDKSSFLHSFSPSVHFGVSKKIVERTRKCFVNLQNASHPLIITFIACCQKQACSFLNCFVCLFVFVTLNEIFTVHEHFLTQEFNNLFLYVFY